MNRQASIDAFALLVLGAAVLVVVAFFLPWFRVSSPIADVLFPGLVYDVSGFKLFIGFPEVGQPGSPVVFAIPLLAIVAVFSSFLAGNAGSFGLVSRVVAVASALAGIALIVLLYLGMQTVWNNELSRLGMFGLLVSRVVKIDLSLGFWLALLGFALIVPLSALRSNRHSRD